MSKIYILNIMRIPISQKTSTIPYIYFKYICSVFKLYFINFIGETMIDLNKEVIEPSKKALVVVDFYADWCGPCKMIGPIMEKLAEEYKVKLVKVNIDKEQKLAEEFGVMSIPTVAFFKDGEPKDFFVGGYPENKIKEFFEKNK